ncbi:MAG: hypothetical protein WA634_11800 [Silvibacterium sp.]
MKVDSIRKIGYSFLGLLAGNVASILTLLILATLQSFSKFDTVRRAWQLSLPSALGMAALFALFSLAGWTVVGLPFVLLMPARVAARLHWLFAALIGGVLGALTLSLIFWALNGWRLDWTGANQAQQLRQWIPFLFIAVLISGTAFAVYCGLLRSE